MSPLGEVDRDTAGAETWHVLGAGAMGCLWAARLAAAGTPVTLLLRSTEAAERFHAGDGVVRLESTAGDIAVRVQAEGPSDGIETVGQLLLTVKAHQVAEALGSVAVRLGTQTTLVTLQNGLGSLDEAMHCLRASKVAAGTTTEGAWLRGPFQAVHAGLGNTWVGPYPGLTPPLSADALVTALGGEQARVQWDPAVLERLWLKLAINCVVNPLTALVDCLNGELLVHAPSRALLAQVSNEVQEVITLAGHPPPRPLLELVTEVLQRTAANRSSMLQDLRSGRLSEIEYINGYLQQTAKRLGYPTPVNTALLDLVRSKQALVREASSTKP